MSTFMNVKTVGAFDEIVNFKTFLNSFQLVFRLSTSAGWNDVLEPLLLKEPACDPDNIMRDGVKVPELGGDCGNPGMAYFFMMAYVITIYLIVINMYIAVILENFNQAHEQEEVGVTEDDFDGFYVVWEKYDPLATQYIKFDSLSSFAADLDKPLGIPKPNEIALVAFDLPIVEGDKIHCLDVLLALVKNVLMKVEETEEFSELRLQLEEKFQDIFPTRVNTQQISSTMQKKKEDVAAKTLQRAWKSFKTQKQLRNITMLATLNKAQEKPKGNTLLTLGRRLSIALGQLFGAHSRPSSAMSRASIGAPTVPKDIRRTMQIPTIESLYADSDKDERRDIEL